MEKFGLWPWPIWRLNILPFSELFYIWARTHDIWYIKGWNSKDKKKVDNMFLRLCLAVSKTKTQIFFAYFYYYMVKIFWFLFFNYN